MRRLVVTSAALALAAGLAGCGKSSDEGQTAGSPTAQTASQPEPSLDQLKAQQASLPAPFNTADLTNGKAKYALCASCHTINPGGSNMTGPNLHGVVGRKAAALDKYNFTAALKGSGITWNAATLDPWLANPRAMVPGTKMSFVGMRDAKDRTDVIAYLMVNSQPAAQ